MAAKSKNTADVLVWLRNVLHSCKTEEQQQSAKRLIGLFETQLRKTGAWKYMSPNPWINSDLGYTDWEYYGGIKEF